MSASLTSQIFPSGILKEKFRILDNGMDFKLETCRMVGVAACVLYNMSLDLGERPVPPPVAEEEGSDSDGAGGHCKWEASCGWR